MRFRVAAFFRFRFLHGLCEELTEAVLPLHCHPTSEDKPERQTSTSNRAGSPRRASAVTIQRKPFPQSRVPGFKFQKIPTRGHHIQKKALPITSKKQKSLTAPAACKAVARKFGVVNSCRRPGAGRDIRSVKRTLGGQKRLNHISREPPHRAQKNSKAQNNPEQNLQRPYSSHESSNHSNDTKATGCTA